MISLDIDDIFYETCPMDVLDARLQSRASEHPPTAHARRQRYYPHHRPGASRHWRDLQLSTVGIWSPALLSRSALLRDVQPRRVACSDAKMDSSARLIGSTFYRISYAPSRLVQSKYEFYDRPELSLAVLGTRLATIRF